MSVTSEVLHFVNNLKPKNHVILFYFDLEDKRKILFNYLSAGLASGKGTAYICSEETPEEIREGMETFGINVRQREKEGTLFIRSYDEWYIQDGKVECVRILASWKRLHEKVRKRGLRLRATGETSCFFKHNKVKELLRYEYSLHRVLDIPMDAVCAYNLNAIVDSGHTEVIMPLVRAHGWAVFTNKGKSMIYEPENVEDYDVEKLLEIKLT
jgi:hypothetical protein